MPLTAEELVRRDEFAAQYRRSTAAPVRQVDCAICGCDYGGTSWADRDEVDRIIPALGLASGVSMLEIGAGAGWPSLYMAGQSGCDVTLIDLPMDGLTVACARAIEEDLEGRCMAAMADAAHLPFRDASFDAINHCDVLCCLVEKQAVLAECRRVLRPAGTMAFSVINIPDGLSAAEQANAAESAPEFTEAEAGYPEMLARTGWEIAEHEDLTDDFARNCLRKIELELSIRDELEPLLNVDFDDRQARMERRIAVLRAGHLRRELFLVRPAA